MVNGVCYWTLIYNISGKERTQIRYSVTSRVTKHKASLSQPRLLKLGRRVGTTWVSNTCHHVQWQAQVNLPSPRMYLTRDRHPGLSPSHLIHHRTIPISPPFRLTLAQPGHCPTTRRLGPEHHSLTHPQNSNSPAMERFRIMQTTLVLQIQANTETSIRTSPFHRWTHGITPSIATLPKICQIAA